MRMGYGDFIKKHRIASGFKSQRKLADKSGVDNSTISRIEKEIQIPEVETLKQLAPYLTSTSLVELMVVCGYWDEEELLDIDSFENQKDEEKKESPSKIEEDSTETEFIEKINLSDKDLLDQFELVLDGKSLSEEETRGIIAYIRSLRLMKN